jgi:hypothetical protein
MHVILGGHAFYYISSRASPSWNFNLKWEIDYIFNDSITSKDGNELQLIFNWYVPKKQKTKKTKMGMNSAWDLGSEDNMSMREHYVLNFMYFISLFLFFICIFQMFILGGVILRVGFNEIVMNCS